MMNAEDLRQQLLQLKKAHTLALRDNVQCRTRLRIAERECKRREAEMQRLLSMVSWQNGTASTNSSMANGGAKRNGTNGAIAVSQSARDTRIELATLKRKVLLYERMLHEKNRENSKLLENKNVVQATEARKLAEKLELECQRLRTHLAQSVPEAEFLREKDQYLGIINRLVEENMQLRQTIGEFEQRRRESEKLLTELGGGEALVRQFRHSSILSRKQATFYKNALDNLLKAKQPLPSRIPNNKSNGSSSSTKMSANAKEWLLRSGAASDGTDQNGSSWTIGFGGGGSNISSDKSRRIVKSKMPKEVEKGGSRRRRASIGGGGANEYSAGQLNKRLMELIKEEEGKVAQKKTKNRKKEMPTTTTTMVKQQRKNMIAKEGKPSLEEEEEEEANGGEAIIENANDGKQHPDNGKKMEMLLIEDDGDQQNSRGEEVVERQEQQQRPTLDRGQRHGMDDGNADDNDQQQQQQEQQEFPIRRPRSASNPEQKMMQRKHQSLASVEENGYEKDQDAELSNQHEDEKMEDLEAKEEEEEVNNQNPPDDESDEEETAKREKQDDDDEEEEEEAIEEPEDLETHLVAFYRVLSAHVLRRQMVKVRAEREPPLPSHHLLAAAGMYDDYHP